MRFFGKPQRLGLPLNDPALVGFKSAGIKIPNLYVSRFTRLLKTVSVYGIVVHTFMNRYFTYLTSNKKYGRMK
jgi:hypothetical protein